MDECKPLVVGNPRKIGPAEFNQASNDPMRLMAMMSMDDVKTGVDDLATGLGVRPHRHCSPSHRSTCILNARFVSGFEWHLMTWRAISGRPSVGAEVAEAHAKAITAERSGEWHVALRWHVETQRLAEARTGKPPLVRQSPAWMQMLADEKRCITVGSARYCSPHRRDSM